MHALRANNYKKLYPEELGYPLEHHGTKNACSNTSAPLGDTSGTQPCDFLLHRGYVPLVQVILPT